MGDYLRMSDEKDGLERQVGDALRDNNLTIAVAESCSGGLISNRITNVPGSSDYFDRGVITYSNKAKMDLLDVPKLILESFGAVSEETARAMANGVRKLAETEIGIAVTGIAGPLGGTPKKPVGLVFIGCATGKSTIVKEFRFSGSRLEIKKQTSEEALKLVLDVIGKN
jgi:nicotinamide-nucleotide amidase